jgi:hypothetical protein
MFPQSPMNPAHAEKLKETKTETDRNRENITIHQTLSILANLLFKGKASMLYLRFVYTTYEEWSTTQQF